APPEKRRAPNLFARVTGTATAWARSTAAEAREPAPAPKPAPAQPVTAQPRLSGLDPQDRLASTKTEEDLLDIPAFLRRPAHYGAPLGERAKAMAEQLVPKLEWRVTEAGDVRPPTPPWFWGWGGSRPPAGRPTEGTNGPVGRRGSRRARRSAADSQESHPLLGHQPASW